MSRRHRLQTRPPREWFLRRPAVLLVLVAVLSAASPALSQDGPQTPAAPGELKVSTENAQAQTEVTVSVQASPSAPFAGDEVTFSAVISDAPADEQPTYQWEIGYGGFWLPAGSDATFSYLPHQPETASVRVTVTYPSGAAATSEPLSVTWRAFVPKPQPPSSDLVRTAVEPVSVSIGFDEDESEVGRPARLVAVVDNLPAGEEPRYRWEMNLGDSWRAVGTDRVFPWTTRIPETARFRVTVFYGSDGAVTSDELSLAWAGGRATRDVTAAQTNTTLVSNTGQANSGSGNANFDHAQAFTTGSNSAGYKLTQVKVDFSVLAGSPPGSDMEIWSDSSGSPGSKLHTLNEPASLTSGTNNFDAPGTGIDLDASTTYHVMWNVVGSGNATLISVWNTASDDEDTGKAAGWSIADGGHYRAYNTSGAWIAWNDARQIAIVGYAKSLEPTLESAKVDGTELVLIFDKDLDTASGTAAGAFTIKVDGGAAQAATAITIADRTVTLTVPAVTPGQTVTVSYTKPATSPLQGADGGEVDAFTDQAVTIVTALISNDGQTSVSGASTSLGLDQAQAFTTGSNSAGYKLTGVEISFISAGTVSDYTAKIMSDSSGSPGSTEVGTLTTLSSVTSGLNEFHGDVDLDANTTYYVVLDVAANNGSRTMHLTASDNEDSGGAAGWSIGNAHHTRNISNSLGWTANASSQSLKIVVNGYAIVPPALESAEVDGTELVLTFDKDLDTTSGTAAGAFTIKADGGAAQAATAITIAARTVTLTVPSVTSGQRVTVSYAKPATNPLEGAGGAEVDAFTDQAVTNSTSIALIGNTGQTTYSSKLFDLDLAQAFTTGSDSEGYKLTSVQISFSGFGTSLPGHEMKIMSDNGSGAPGSTTVGTLTSPASLVFGLIAFTGDVDLDANTTYHVVMDLTASGSGVFWATTGSDNEDSGGAAGWSIGNRHHRRNVNDSGGWTANTEYRLKIIVNGLVNPPATALDSAEIDGTELVLTFDGDLDTASGTAAGAFEIKVDGGAAQAATAITIADRTVTLTVPKVTPGQTVTVSYTKPATNPLEGADGDEVDGFTDQEVTNNTRTVILIANTGAPNATIGSGLQSDRAQSFTTGSNSAGYRMTGLNLVMHAGGSASYSARIALNSGAGPGPATVANLEEPSSLTTGSNNEFTGEVDLLPSTIYFFEIDSQANSSAVLVRHTNGDDEDSGGAAGWSIGNVQYRRNWDSSGAWESRSQALKISVSGYTKAHALDKAEIDGTELVLTYDGNLDTASGTAAGAFTISADGGAAQAATAITIAGKTVTLTVPEVTEQQTVTVTYTKPATNPLKDSNAQAVNSFTDRAVTHDASNTARALVKNSAQATAPGSTGAVDAAQPFTTGSHSVGYKLTSVQIDAAAASSATTYTVKIMSESGGKPGSTEVGSLTRPSSLTTGSNNEFTGDVDLDANTTYYIVVDQTVANSARFRLTTSDAEDGGRAAGWSLGDGVWRRNVNNSGGWNSQWAESMKVIINGYAKQPATSALVGNNSQADHATLNFGLFTDRAQSFTTGANSTGYRLKNVQIAVATAGTPTGYKVKIAADSGSGPGADVATLTNPSSLTVGLNSFTGDVDLAPNTTYYIVTDLPRNNAAAWKRTSSGAEDSGGAAGWSIGDKFWARNFGWAGAYDQSPTSDVLKVVVNGYAKPTSSTATADAGEDQSVQTGDTVTLDASGSATTKAGATLTYAWTQTSGPTVTLSDDTAANPTFTAPTYRADYVFSLVVDDGDGISAADTVAIAVRPPINPATAPCQVPDEDATVDSAVISSPTTTASAVTWGATATSGAGTADLYLCSPDGTRELVGSAVATGSTTTKSSLDSGTKYWVGALKTKTSDSSVSWSGWKAATTTGGASIVDVRIVSTPRWDADDDGVPETYGRGDKILVDVTWSQDVTVTGEFSDVRMRLDVGSDDSDLTNSRKVARLESASGARLRFAYTVTASDEDDDGVWVQTSSATNLKIIFLAGTPQATIKNGTDNAKLTKSGLATSGDPKHLVDHQYFATAPAFPNATETLTIDENSAEGDTVGTVTATDADGDTLYYSLRATGDNSRFTIGQTGSDAGTIKVGPGQNFDFENAPNSYTVTVDVTDRKDSDGNAETPPYTTDDTVTVTINETDVDEPPGAPTVTAVTGVSTTSVTVTWTAPSDTGAEAITDYDLRYYAGSAEPTDAADWIEEGETNGHTHTGAATTATITGLAEGTTYQVQVRAEGEGEGAWSATESGATLDPPPAPRNLWARGAAGAVYLHWSNPGDSTITKYEQRQSTDGGTTWTAWTDISGSNANTIQSSNFGLTNGTYYDFELRSVHAIGASKTGAIGVAANNVGVSAPQDLSASAADTQVTLNWSAVSSATRYRVKHRATGGSWSSWTTISSGSTTTHTETGLTNGTTYRFEVQAGQTSAWHRASAIEATPTPRAAAPGNFTALPGNRSIMLSWDDPGDNAITKYEIRQSTDGGTTWTQWAEITGSGSATTSHTLSNLTNGTTYTIELRASRDTVAGAVSSATATPNLPPPAPSGLSSTAGDGVVDLSWTDPSDSNITKYQYRRKAGSGNWSPDWTDIPMSGAATTSYQVTGLTNDTTYTIEVRAVRSGPLYGAASSTTAIPRPSVPAAPASFAATAGDGLVDLAWTDPSNSQITAYQYRYKAGTGNWNPNWTDITGSSATTTSYQVTGLTNDTAYTFEVRAKAGAVIIGTASSASATPRPTAPPAPSGFTATAGDGRVDLAWTDPSDTLITRYQVRQKEGTNAWGSWADISGSGAGTVSHRVTGLTNDTAYTFEVRARRGTVTHGTASSATATPRPTAPPAPSNLRADVGNEQITLRWSNPNDSRITLYQYRQKVGSGSFGMWTDISGSGSSTTSHTVTSLTNDTQYTFEVRARRGTVTHGGASSVTQTPRPPAPPAPSGLTADPGNTEIKLDWTDPSDTLISVYQYRLSTDGGANWSPDWTDITGSDKDTVTHTLTGLTNDTTYTIEVRARRGTATTGAASRATATPKAPPAAPRGLWANPSTGQIVLKWANPNDSTITHYEFRQKAGSGSWSPDWTDISSSDATTTSLTRTGLTDTTHYELEVRAVRGKSNEGTAAAIGATPDTGPGPGTLSATAADTQVTLSWGEGPSNVDRYRVRHRATTTTTWGSWTDISGRTTTTHTETSLTNGTTYRFEVQAGTSATNFGPGSAIQAKPTERAAAPLNFDALPGNRTIRLSWTDPNDSNITKYQVRRKAGSAAWGAWTDISGSGATTTTHTITGLTNGTTYTVEVRAFRGTTDGAVSSATATPNVPPARPGGLSATPGDGKVDLSWNNPSDSSIANYQYRASDDSGMTWDPDWTDTGDANTTTLSVTGLANDTTYTIELRAARSGRLYGPAASRTSTPRPTAPPAPTSFTATAGNTEVDLAWDDPSDTLITKYQVRRRAGSGAWGAWADISGSGAATTMHKVTGLTNDTAYTFQVRARRGTVTHGAVASASATPRPAAPPAPTGLGATAGDGRVTLSWTDPSDSLITKYRYRQSTDGGVNWSSWTVISTSSASTTMHPVTGLTNDTDYTFELQARRGTVTYGASASATATTRPAAPPAPTNIRAEVGDGQITVRWNNPGDSRISVYSHREREGTGPWSPGWTDIPMSNASTTSLVSTGLTNDEEYTFEVRARRGTVTYGTASSVSATPRPAAPPAPTGLSADPGNAQVVLKWTDPMDTRISKYQMRQKAGSAAWTAWADISGSDKDTVTHTVSSLTNDTVYLFEIRAQRGAVTTGAATRVAVTPKAPPPAPRNLRATPSSGQIVVDWTNPNDATVTKYQFHQKPDGGSWTAWADISGSGAATVSHTVTGANGTYLDIEVRAVRGSENAGAAAAIGATPSNATPAAPAGLRATAADTQVTLSWDQGGSTVTRYRVRHRATTTTTWESWSTEQTGTTYTQSSLTNTTTYRFEVAAGTATAWGPATAIQATPTERPAAPVNLVAAARSRTIALSWDDPLDSNITRYQYRQKAGTGNWNPDWTNIAGSDDTTTTHTLSNLANGTTYTIEVRAARGATLGVGGQVMSTPRPAPSRPTGFTATAGDEEVMLGWTDPGDSSISKYQSRHRADGETVWTDWTDISGATTISHTVTSLMNDTTYTFELRAVRDRDNAGPSTSATATPKPPPPAAVTGLTATPGDRRIALSWTNPGDSRISKYEYRRRQGSGGWTAWADIPNSDDSTASHTVDGLRNDTDYTVEVRAVRGADTAGEADSVTTKTPKPAPTGLTAIAGNAQVELTWTNPRDNEITTYQIRQKVGTAAFGGWADIAGSDASTVAHTVLNLANDTEHTFEIRALGTAPQEGVAARVESTPVDTSSVPAAPQEARATAGNARVSLSWANPQDDQITNYQYRVSADGGATWDPDWTDIENSSATTVSHTVSSLTNGTTYQIDIRAVNSTGNGAVTSLIATPKAPPPPRSSGGGGAPAALPPVEPEDFARDISREITASQIVALATGGSDGAAPVVSGSAGSVLVVQPPEDGSGVGRLVVYTRSGGLLQAGIEIELDPQNTSPQGVASQGSTAWVTDSETNTLFAYDLVTGRRDPTADIALDARHGTPKAVLAGPGRVFALHNPLVVYDRTSGNLIGEYSLDAANADPRGAWSDGTTIWVSDQAAGHIFAYRLPTTATAAGAPLVRVRGEEFGGLSDAGNDHPAGIWSDGATMFVVDSQDGRIYAYNMPAGIITRLAALTLTGVDIGRFSPDVTTYEGTATAGLEHTTITATAARTAATVLIEPADASNVIGHQVDITDGTEITVTVTSSDGSRHRTYQIQVTGPPQGYFVDDEGSVHETNINAIAAAGITTGCATEPARYCPDRPVTRAQLATFLTRALKLPTPEQPAGFTDINPTSTHTANINAIAAAGITTGCATGPLRYCPDQPVTRAQMATFLARALKLPTPEQPAGFTDIDPTSTHTASINAIAAAGITTGCGTEPLRYCPDEPVTRAQMATFLARALKLPFP